MVEETNTGVCIRNNLFTSMKKMIDSFFVKPVQTTSSETQGQLVKSQERK